MPNLLSGHNLRQLHFATRAEWRNWLAQNHDKEAAGIWLVYHKQDSGKPTLTYDESVEEALCFGWVDSLIRNLDTTRYCRKFTPRKNDSKWSESNKTRVQKLIQQETMTEFGLAKVKAAKKLGTWQQDPKPEIRWELPQDLITALAQHPKANDFFERLSMTHRKQFIGWLITAKRPETKARRLNECLRLLAKGERLGLR